MTGKVLGKKEIPGGSPQPEEALHRESPQPEEAFHRGNFNVALLQLGNTMPETEEWSVLYGTVVLHAVHHSTVIARGDSTGTSAC